MSEEQNTTTQNPAPAQNATPSAAPSGAPADAHVRRNQDADRQQPRRNPRRFGGRNEGKAKPEFDQKIIDIRRVTRVVAGGRRFSFSVAIVIGDRRGSVGVGLGKAGDTALAIEKALKNAKKNMIKVNATKTMSIPYETEAKFSASRVVITPAPGHGVVAGSSVRSVIELAGLKDVGAKLRSGSKNRINNARVAIEALRKITTHRKVLLSRRAAATKATQTA